MGVPLVTGTDTEAVVNSTRRRGAHPERPAVAAAGGLADLVERACRWRAGSRRKVGVQGSSPVVSGIGPWPCQAESAPGRADLDYGEVLPTRACRLAGRTHGARTRHARTPGENPARPGRLLRIAGIDGLRFRAFAAISRPERYGYRGTANAVGWQHPPGFKSPILRSSQAVSHTGEVKGRDVGPFT